jgi:V/A-type H+-transporting ATPase subunit I
MNLRQRIRRLRPRTTHWFELYVPRHQTVYALEALSGTGKVELERDYIERPLPDTQVLRERVQRARAVIERYAQLLPPDRAFQPVVVEDAEAQALSALQALRDGIARRLRLQRRQRELDRRLHQLGLLQRCLHAMGGFADEILEMPEEEVFLSHRIFACPADAIVNDDDEEPGTARQFADSHYRFYVDFCLPEDSCHHRQPFRTAHCEAVDIPAWLTAETADRDTRIQQEIQRLQAAAAQTRQEIEQPGDGPRLAAALNEIAVLDWFLERTVTLGEDQKFCYVTGWTTALDPLELQQALDRARIDARVLFRPMSPGHAPPVDLADGALTGPFRQFVRMFGAPEPGEVDPTPIIAVLYPTLFGFMFADVGHGLVLVAASLLLHRRFPQTRFLLFCGLGATAFGMAFGEAFGLHLPWQPLAPCPLENPLVILVASMVLGALVMLLGLALSSIEAAWRGELKKWAWQEGAVLAGYIGCLAAILQPYALGLVVFALAWFLLGIAVTGEKTSSGLGRLARSTLELSLNTLSFARIGAFAIAHTALTHTVVELAAGADNPVYTVTVFVIGHALLVLLEGLVVFIQTTRLILFEFFTRFLHANGRIFRPLSAKRVTA